MATQPRIIIPDSATRLRREEELVAKGVMTELRAALAPGSDPDFAVADTQRSLMHVARGRATADAYAAHISTSGNRNGHLLALKGAVCVNAAGEQSGQQPSILFNTSRQRLRERLPAAVGLKAEGLSEDGAIPGDSARIVAVVSFYNGSITNMPDHASIKLSLHVMGDEHFKWVSIMIDGIATFSTDHERGHLYYNKIMSDVRQLGQAQVQRPGGEIMPVVRLNGPVPKVDHFVMSDRGLSFAFALEKVIDPSTGAGKTLTEYVAIFASYAVDAPMAAASHEDGPSYFSCVVLLHRGVQDVDDDELDGMDD
ncbi:unnamed protein product [Colletotrichum noveboracense]|uniref:Uncharacterized protein n=1 Tax=Colletotrichum noveboracense TaxID=2664923 RepID=A0A9W4WEX6_9PEZI|nr:unnamed protein product [Colletotrichum noveboracense]